MILLLALLPVPAGAVTLELEAAQVELGQPLRGAVHGVELPTAEVLRPLEADFAVVMRGGAERQADGSHRLGFSLYPRREGGLAVALPGGEPLAVNVTAAVERGQPLQVRQWVSTASPWVRQQVLVTLEVLTPEPYASLQADPISLPGFEVIPLPGSSEQVGTQTRLRAGWALFAVAPGHYRPALPPLRYQLSGATRRLFPLELPALEARALPPYVPPTLPVGKVELTSRVEPDGLLHTGHLAHWRVSVSAPAVPPTWLPPVLRGLAGDGIIDFLPVQSSYTLTPDAAGVHARAEHLLPLRPRRDGRVPLPVLELQYFDPDSGRLERVVHLPPQPLALGRVMRWGAGILLLALAAWSWPRLWRRGRGWWQRRRMRRAALAQLAVATDAAAIRAALRSYAAVGGAANLTLEQWQQRYGTALTDDLLRLAAASYGGDATIDVIRLREQLLQRLR